MEFDLSPLRIVLSAMEFHLLVLTLAWVGGFVPLFLRRRLTWVQCVGLAFILYPFIAMALNIVRAFPSLLTPTVLQPASAVSLWLGIENRLWYNLALPLLGIFLLHNPYEDAGDGGPRAPRFLDALASHGAAPRHSARRDALRGLSLFVFIALAYVIAYTVSVYLTPVLSPGSDESLYWRNITIPLILLLSLSAGITEEFLFRGILLHGLARRMPWLAAALVQATFFGLVHAGYGTWTHVIGPFLFGLGMAWVARRLGIFVTALLHAGVNVVFLAIDVAPTYAAVNGVVGLAGLLGVAIVLLLACASALRVTRGEAVRILWDDIAGLFRMRKRAEVREATGEAR